MSNLIARLPPARLLTAVWAMILVASAANGAAPDFLAQARALSDDALAAEKSTIVGSDGWLFFAPELRHLGVGPFWGSDAAKVSRAVKPEQADPLPAIIDFKRQLDRAGIELLVVPVPPKAVIYPEFVFDKAGAGSNPRFDTHHQAFYAALREAGVNVVDLVPEFMAHRTESRLYCQRDTHWSGAGLMLAASLLGREIRGRAWFASVARREFDQEIRSVEIAGDLGPAANAEPKRKETLPLRFVGTSVEGGIEPVSPDQNSPVVLLGDSHNLIFHAGADLHAVGAGLPDQLALELGFPVDVVAVRGSGATPARVNLLRRSRTPGYLAGKKIVIWCFAAREFTESSGWMNVPVVR